MAQFKELARLRNQWWFLIFELVGLQPVVGIYIGQYFQSQARAQQIYGESFAPPINDLNSHIGELLPHHQLSDDYSLPSWKGQFQTECIGKEKGGKPQAQEQ